MIVEWLLNRVQAGWLDVMWGIAEYSGALVLQAGNVLLIAVGYTGPIILAQSWFLCWAGGCMGARAGVWGWAGGRWG